MSVITNSLAMMDTSSAVTSLDADAVVYDNTTSGLSATDAQAAIDELDSTINTISTEIGSLNAADVAFSDTTRSASIYTGVTNVEEALMAIKGGIGAIPVIEDAGDVSFTSCQGTTFKRTNPTNVDEALNALSGAIDKLDTTNISIPSAKRTGIYANSTTAQDALDAIKTALDSGGGSVNAADVTFDSEGSSWSGSCAGNVETALFDLDERVAALSGGGGGGSTDASDVTFDYNKGGCWDGGQVEDVESALFDLDIRIQHSSQYAKPQNSIYGANTDTVHEALDDVSTVIQTLDSTDIAIPAASKTGIYANTATVQAALDAIKTAISSGGGGSSSAASVSFTKPQDSIYGANTDTVQEALEDVNYKIIYLEASDIGFLGSGCGGGYPTDVETVQDALNALEHLLYKYSEYEAETGWLWFNDKPIYQISVEVESGVTNLFDTNELEIDDLVYMEATLTNSGGTKRWTISGSSGDFYWDTATHMIVYGGSDVVTTATIRYTKTSE